MTGSATPGSRPSFRESASPFAENVVVMPSMLSAEQPVVVVRRK